MSTEFKPITFIKTSRSPPSKGKRPSSPNPAGTFTKKPAAERIYEGSYENHLREVLNKIMPEEYAFEKKNPRWLSNPFNPAAKLEIDFCNDALDVYIEYHGKQHFVFSERDHKTQENFEYQLSIDRHKRITSAEKGHLLIVIDSRKYSSLDNQLRYIYKEVLRRGNDSQKFVFAKYWLMSNLKYTNPVRVDLGRGLVYVFDFNQEQPANLSSGPYNEIVLEGVATRREYRIVKGEESYIESEISNVEFHFYISPHHIEHFDYHRSQSPNTCVLINQEDIRVEKITVQAIERKLEKEGVFVLKKKSRREYF
ncbi:hypothetical protein BNJ_00344 [Kaumoebavirus]|uniref:hypothetical protein n=1 Tax=Kaumoebavirus TaxID=1859492 RepID=UPI0009C2F9DE|nr:hypothetical protein BNJ_00344 [Kaumoebavirus]ARA72164.1 hypothetical protein BNJ_00344 [Kaumoebavirus]